MKIVPIKSIIDIAKGDWLIVTGNHSKGPKTQFHTVDTVKVTERDGTEVILHKRSNTYFNLGMYLSGQSWVSNVGKVIVDEEPTPKGMQVDFNNLRRQACKSYNALVEKLNDAILTEEQWAIPNDVYHGQAMDVKGYVLIDAEQLERDLADLRTQLATIAMVYEPGDENFKDVFDKPLVEFNPEE